MSRFLPFWFFFLGLGVLALLSRRGGWPFLLGLGLALRVGVGQATRGRPAKKGRKGRPGAQPKGKEGEGPGPILKERARPDPRAKEA